MSSAPMISLVLPCFNEEQVLRQTARRLSQELDGLVGEGLVSPLSRIVFVDDGSRDGTWRIIAELADSGGNFSGIRLTRNFGHQYALYAGLMLAPGDALISLDADLQDDVSVLRPMLAAFAGGHEIVYGVRSDRSSDTPFKRLSARAHYRLAAWLGVETIPEHADFRLMSRRAVGLLSRYRESNLYLRGIVPLLGLRSCSVAFRRERGRAGTRNTACDECSAFRCGLTSFSIMPLRLIAVLGLLVFAISILMGIWALAAGLLGGRTVPGWASTVIPIYLLGGLQLLAIGVAGEYIGKTYLEVKQRPLFLVQETRSLVTADDVDSGMHAP